jgi:hypothetical protein
MRYPHALITCIALACAIASAQSVRTSSDAFPISPAQPAPMPSPLVLPVMVAPAIAPAWEVQIADVNLSNTFQRWAALAGYRVKWDANRNVLIDAPGRIEGSFEEAVERVLASPGIRQSEYPLEVCFYPNTPPLARVTRRGEQLKECK